MKNLIRHILKEETNKSLKLLNKYYNIKKGTGTYVGDGWFKTSIMFTPKDFDDIMTPYFAESICNWQIIRNSKNEYDIRFKYMKLPDPVTMPLIEYIGNTDELELYLQHIHRVEAEKSLQLTLSVIKNPIK